MRVAVRHHTRYAYASPAKSVLQLLRMTPRDHDGQAVKSWRIVPNCEATLKSGEDPLGNLTHMLSLSGPISELDIAKIWAGPPCLQPCPLPGSWYDGANCWVATPPAGTTPFTYAGNLYYSPVYAPSCPVAGSAYDGANCYIQTPSGTTPFVWNGNLYYSPQPGPSWTPRQPQQEDDLEL